MPSMNLHYYNSFSWIISCIDRPTIIIQYREQSPNLSWASPQTTVKPVQPTSCGHSGKESPSASASFLEWDVAEKNRWWPDHWKYLNYWVEVSGLRFPSAFSIDGGSCSPPLTTLHSSPEQNLNKAGDVTLYILYLVCNLNSLFLPHAVMLNYQFICKSIFPCTLVEHCF